MEQLSIINVGLLRKRIKREIEMLVKENICSEDNIQIKEKIEPQYSSIKDYSIQFKNLKDNNCYQFITSSNYPFKPPKVFINNKPLQLYHQIANVEFKAKLRKYTGIECFCCETILCCNNWDPQFTIKNVLDDINKYRDARREVIVRIIIDVIKRKYLIDDTNIVEWLY